MSDRIRWGPTGFGGFTGHVGGEGLEVFRLWRLDRDVTWILAADLPGESRYADDPDELKRAAEDWLAGFISSLGAAFPAEPKRLSRAWHADWAEVDRDSSGNAILRHKPTGGMYKILPVEEC